MKKIHVKAWGIVLLLLAGVCLSACSNDDDDWIWDFAPIQIEFNIVDDSGANLIAEGEPLFGADFSVVYKGTTYDADWDDGHQSRYYMPYMHGLVYYPATEGPIGRLVFGELDGTLREADLLFCMPDGSQHNIRIECDIKIKGSDCTVKEKVKVDGQELNPKEIGSTYITLTFKYQPR